MRFIILTSENSSEGELKQTECRWTKINKTLKINESICSANLTMEGHAQCSLLDNFCQQAYQSVFYEEGSSTLAELLKDMSSVQKRYFEQKYLLSISDKELPVLQKQEVVEAQKKFMRRFLVRTKVRGMLQKADPAGIKRFHDEVRHDFIQEKVKEKDKSIAEDQNKIREARLNLLSTGKEAAPKEIAQEANLSEERIEEVTKIKKRIAVLKWIVTPWIIECRSIKDIYDSKETKRHCKINSVFDVAKQLSEIREVFWACP
jgi:hypothetical protein